MFLLRILSFKSLLFTELLEKKYAMGIFQLEYMPLAMNTNACVACFGFLPSGPKSSKPSMISSFFEYSKCFLMAISSKQRLHFLSFALKLSHFNFNCFRNVGSSPVLKMLSPIHFLMVLTPGRMIPCCLKDL